MLDPVKYNRELNEYILREEEDMYLMIIIHMTSVFERLEKIATDDSKLDELEEYRILILNRVDEDPAHAYKYFLDSRPDERVPDSSMIKLLGLKECLEQSVLFRFEENLVDGFYKYIHKS